MYSNTMVHEDKILTNLSIAYKNADLVADQLIPTLRVQKQSDKYWVFPLGAGSEFGAGHSDVRAPGTEANTIHGGKLSRDNYYAANHALQADVTDEERDNADVPIQPDKNATDLVTNQLLLNREVAVANLATNPDTYAPGLTVTLSGTDQFNDPTSDPFGTITEAIENLYDTSGLEPTVCVIPQKVFNRLKEHPALIERIKYSQKGVLTEQLVAELLDLPTVVVPKAKYGVANAQTDGVVGPLTSIWPNDIVLLHVEGPAQNSAQFALNFTWKPFTIDRWREEQRKTDVIRNSVYYDIKLTAVDANGKSIAGALIKNAVA